MIRTNVWLRTRSLISAVALTFLSRHFEKSRAPDEMPALLAIVFVLSSFLDNIAAVLIGGTIALAILGWNPDPPRKVELRSAHITQITLGDVS
jgi:hypothetical protein